MLSAYPACFFKEENGYSVIFPDSDGLATCGETLDEAFAMAVDCLAGYLDWLRRDGEAAPAPSAMEQINLAQVAAELETEVGEAFVNMVTVDVAEYAKTHFGKFVKKTLTIPKGLYTVAVEQDIDLSQVLQDAMKEKLHPASTEQIRRMIKTADGDTYEDLRSLEQALTFHAAEETFARHKLDFGEDKFYVLGIRTRESELFTNLGLLLSDQCVHTVKAAVFADDEKTVFRSRKEFSGSLFRQLEETFNYLQLCNQNRSVIRGLEREDYWDYPGAAIREALLNALIHRDYSFSGSTIINVNASGMEFISMGGLMAGLTPEDIRTGISQPRNRKLAEVFHWLNFIEAYGTGIRRIFALYQGCPNQPVIEATPNSFKIILPNQNAAGALPPHAGRTVTPQMQAVLDFLAVHGEVNDQELQELLDVRRTRAYTLTKEMEEAGLLRIVGRGKQRKYVLLPFR